jgi:hypothetical protein
VLCELRKQGLDLGKWLRVVVHLQLVLAHEITHKIWSLEVMVHVPTQRRSLDCCLSD